MNLVQIKTAPNGTADALREMADAADRGELTDLVCVACRGGAYEFHYSASLAHCITMAAILLQNCIDRMRR